MDELRTQKAHDLAGEIRELVRLHVDPADRPAGLFSKCQELVYLFRGREPDDATRPVDDRGLLPGGRDRDVGDLAVHPPGRPVQEAADGSGLGPDRNQDHLHLRACLEAYEQWEADLVMDSRCWVHGTAVVVDGEHFESLIRIQGLRNRALGRFAEIRDLQNAIIQRNS